MIGTMQDSRNNGKKDQEAKDINDRILTIQSYYQVTNLYFQDNIKELATIFDEELKIVQNMFYISQKCKNDGDIRDFLEALNSEFI